MQCPVCEQDAPVAAFGDPLRCPECGAFYEKAVQLKAKKDAMTAVAVPPASPRHNTGGVAPTNIGTPESIKASNKFWLRIFVVFGVAVIAFSVYMNVFAPSNSDARGGRAATVPAKADCGSAGMAYVMSGNFVKRELLAPSSAKFPYSHEPGVIVVPLENCRYQILSYVDSQNAFGAMIRSRYTVTMESLEGGRNWRAHELVIE